jgi:hypothetical protein
LDRIIIWILQGVMSESTTAPPLTKIIGKPDALTLRQCTRELYTNARQTPTDLGGGFLGYLGAIMPAAEYALLPNTVPFIEPIHPGVHEGLVQGATQAVITETNRAHKAACAASNKYQEVTQALKMQLLEAVEDSFVSALSDDLVGYAMVSCADLMAHLQTTYGTITPDQLSANRDIFAAEWNHEAPIEDVWKRTQNCRHFATAGGDPISESETVRTLLSIIEKAALLANAVTDWRKRPQIEWTLANFKIDFTRANNERVRCLTVGNTGHSANAATTPPTGTASPSITTDGTKMYYCWSHGLGTNPNHCSAACNNKKDGHIDNATAITIQGGSTRLMTGRRDAGASGGS